MKAVVVEGPNAVSYREVRAPTVGPGDVLVHSREAGLCRTDIEMMTGVFTDPRWVRFPVIPGHEWAGTVVEVGADVESVKVGDRVVCEGFVVCHRCRRCRSGETQWCERIEALGFTRPGGYAELVAVPEQVVHRLPEHVSFDAGVLVEPASVVLRGLEKAGPKPGEAVGVIGVGTLGALAIALLRLHSPSRIVAYGVREEELELARRLGATEVVLAGDGTPAQAELDLVVETAGVPGAVTLATQLCRPGRPGRAARDRRRGPDADPPLRPARERGPGPHRQHRVPGVDLVARRRADLRPRPRPRPDRDAPLPDGRLRGGGGADGRPARDRREDRPRALRHGRTPQLGVARPPGPRRVPAPLLAEVQRRERRGVSRPSRDRDLQLVVGARQLQRAPARAGRGGQARRPAGRRLPARVPGHVARRVADEADDDALPQPHGDGRRGVDPLLPPRRRRPADRLRQDEPRVDPGRVLGEHPDHRRHGRADAQRPLARQGARLVLGLLALPRGAARRPHQRAGLHRDRGLHVALERALHDDGDRVDDGLRDRGARADAAGRRGHPGGRLAPRAPGRDGGTPDRRARRAATCARRTSSRARRSRTPSARCTRSPGRPTRSST